MQGVKRHDKFDPKKGWIKAVLLVVLWLLIVSLVRDYGRISVGFERKKMAERRLVEEKEKSQALRGELVMVSGLEYREKLIREKLNMQKNGEIVVVLPAGEADQSFFDQKNIEIVSPNWKKWLKLVAY